MPFDSYLAKEALSKFSEQSVADTDLPCRCRHCLWECYLWGGGAAIKSQRKKKATSVPSSLGQPFPAGSSLSPFTSITTGGCCFRYEGGIIERSTEYLDVMRTLRGATLEEKAILDKKDLIKELRDLREAQQRIEALYHGSVPARLQP